MVYDLLIPFRLGIESRCRLLGSDRLGPDACFLVYMSVYPSAAY